jgi:hypothetical protein
MDEGNKYLYKEAVELVNNRLEALTNIKKNIL